MPVQYTIDSSGHTAVYVPILQMLQSMFKNTDLLDKIQETKPSPPGMHMSHEDGTYFKESQLLPGAGELKLSLILYVDDIELANPLGMARKIHKLYAVYGLLANVPSKDRSSLHDIQLALLCKVSVLQRCGYKKVLSPLLKDLHTLEKDGIFIETVGQSLAGFVQCFRGHYVCIFCFFTADQIQTSEVSEGELIMRTRASHDLYVQNVVQGENATQQKTEGRSEFSP